MVDPGAQAEARICCRTSKAREKEMGGKLLQLARAQLRTASSDVGLMKEWTAAKELETTGGEEGSSSSSDSSIVWPGLRSVLERGTQKLLDACLESWRRRVSCAAAVRRRRRPLRQGCAVFFSDED